MTAWQKSLRVGIGSLSLWFILENSALAASCHQPWIDFSEQKWPFLLDGFWEHIPDATFDPASVLSEPTERRLLGGYPLKDEAEPEVTTPSWIALRLHMTGLAPRPGGYHLRWLEVASEPWRVLLLSQTDQETIAWQKPSKGELGFSPQHKEDLWTLVLLFHSTQKPWRQRWQAPILERNEAPKSSSSRGLWRQFWGFLQGQMTMRDGPLLVQCSLQETRDL